MPDPKIEFLINNLQEGLDVEAKNWLGGLAENSHKAKLAKEIIALGNQGGGYIFIGYDDAANLAEIPPNAAELEAFTQDAVASIVGRYVIPPCQCRVEYASPAGSAIVHPVIVVPGGHRTPLFAARGSEDGALQNGKVYVRRPGGSSEEARTQDDWEKLLERLVRARQTDMLDAIREIITPQSAVVPDEEVQSLEDWRQQQLGEWQNIVGGFDADDPRRLQSGYWTVAFAIHPFATESLAELNEALDRVMPKHSGWPPFTYLHRDPVRPQAYGDSIVAYIGNIAEGEAPADRAENADYWVVSREGKGFLLRPMQEDMHGYPGEIYPPPQGPFFDWVFPIYRCAEILKHIEALATSFSTEQATFELKLNYYNTAGRHLESATRNLILDDGARCDANELSTAISAPVADIGTNLAEIIYGLLRPLYEQFQFTELPRALINNVVAEVLNTRMR